MAVVKLDGLFLLHETPEEDAVATRLKQKEKQTKEKKNSEQPAWEEVNAAVSWNCDILYGFYVDFVGLCLSGPSGQLFETLPTDIPRSSGNG